MVRITILAGFYTCGDCSNGKLIYTTPVMKWKTDDLLKQEWSWVPQPNIGTLPHLSTMKLSLQLRNKSSTSPSVYQ